MNHPDPWWVGHLAMTVATAAVSPTPKPLLRSALRDFLASRPEGCELAAMIRQTQRGKS